VRGSKLFPNGQYVSKLHRCLAIENDSEPSCQTPLPCETRPLSIPRNTTKKLMSRERCGRVTPMPTHGQLIPTVVLATSHIRSKTSAHVGSTGSFALLSPYQVSGVKVSCIIVYFLHYGTDMRSSWQEGAMCQPE
jgi:hypothetical protein